MVRLYGLFGKGSAMEDNLIIIRVDGGIASQIGFVALGKAFEEKAVR